jgi:hypothetical protein
MEVIRLDGTLIRSAVPASDTDDDQSPFEHLEQDYSDRRWAPGHSSSPSVRFLRSM